MLNKNILKNTLMLYIRQILILFVNLYSVRVVLNILGFEDFGIYSVVAGIVTLCSFLNGSMASATQRFFSYALGENNELLLNKTFSVNLIVYIAIGFIALTLLTSIGLWIIPEYLNVPEGRLDSVISLYKLSVFTFIFSVFTSPFIAIIIAHEDMRLYALISIAEALMKLGVVFVLTFFQWDKLELYGFLLLVVSILNMFMFISVSISKYKECQFNKFYWDKDLLKEIVHFTGWTLFGQMTTVAKSQAITILLNQFFNPVVAASRAISISVSSQAMIFANSFNIGLYPPIIKSYANKKTDELLSLIYNGTKLTFFLMWIVSLPLLLEMNAILTLWLETPPKGTVLFTQLALIETLIVSLSLPISTAARAPGKMKTYELTLGTMQLGILLMSYVLLSKGFEAYSVFLVAIFVNIIMFIVRIIIVAKMIQLSIINFTKLVISPILIVAFMSSLISIIIKNEIANGVASSMLTICISIIVSSVLMYWIGLDKLQRNIIREATMLKVRKMRMHLL